MKKRDVSFGLGLGDLLKDLGGLVDAACNFNVKIGELKDENKRIMEPIVNVVDEGDYIVVISELPGIEENQIQIHIINSCLKICAFGVKNYRANIPLPYSVDEKTVIYLYKEGILEITVRKK